MRCAASLSRALLGLLVILAAVAVIAEHGSLPHRHASPSPALFNEEHDLTHLAAGGAAALAPMTLLVVAVVLVAGVAVRAPWRPALAPVRAADPRAPPAR